VRLNAAMKFKRIRGKLHLVFDSRQEFEEHFLKEEGVVPPLIENWRLGKQGDWVLSDDTAVVQILKWFPSPHPHDRANYKAKHGICRTVVGTFVQDDKHQMDTDFDLHQSRYTISGKPGDRTRRNAENLTKRERVFVAAIISGKTVEAAFIEAYGLRSNLKERISFLLRRKIIMDTIKEQVVSSCSKLGITVEWYLQLLKDLAENARDPRTQLGSLKEIGEVLRVKEAEPARTSNLVFQSSGQFQGFDMSRVKQIEAEEVAVMAGSSPEEVPNVEH
jgi:hypothetical protein